MRCLKLYPNIPINNYTPLKFPQRKIQHKSEYNVSGDLKSEGDNDKDDGSFV